MSCEEFGLEASDLGLGYKISTSLITGTTINTLTPNLKDVEISAKSLTSRFWKALGSGDQSSTSPVNKS